MSNPSEKSSTPKFALPVQTIVLAGIAWAVLALLVFLLNSTGEERDRWYLYATYIFEEVAYLGAFTLCFRNWRSPQIVSGRNVWLLIGLGMLSYFIGTLLFGVWELVFALDPEISLGDLFYIATYICLGWGMILAVRSKRLNLVWWQWVTVAAIAAVGIALATWVTLEPAKAQAVTPPAAITQTIAQATPTAKPAPKTPAPTAKPAPKPKATKAAPVVTPKPEPSTAASAPAFILAIDEFLKPFADPVNLFYVVADVFLLIIATMLLLAFWGGRFSQSWRMIAGAAVSLYIADMWLKYAYNRYGDEYKSGHILEVFFVFSGVLFAIGAALEHDTSSRSRRAGSRKRG